MRLKLLLISHYFVSPDRVDVAESLQINIVKLSDNSLDARFQTFVGQEGGLGLCVPTSLLYVVDSGEHANPPVLQDGQLLR